MSNVAPHRSAYQAAVDFVTFLGIGEDPEADPNWVDPLCLPPGAYDDGFDEDFGDDESTEDSSMCNFRTMNYVTPETEKNSVVSEF